MQICPKHTIMHHWLRELCRCAQEYSCIDRKWNFLTRRIYHKHITEMKARSYQAPHDCNAPIAGQDKDNLGRYLFRAN